MIRISVKFVLFVIMVLGILVTHAIAQPAESKLIISNLFTDNMVLQQQSKVPIWGTAKPASEISVEINGQKKYTMADSEGIWEIILDPMDAGGPYELKITGEHTIALKNILVGEVWVGSGQSNMEMPLAGWGKVLNYEEEIAGANFPQIRLLQVDRTISFKPENDIPASGWQICSPKTIPEFSSTAYFFGRHLYRELNIPIGLIHSSWGGTIVEAWISGKSMKQFSDFKDDVETMEKMASNGVNLKVQSQNYEQKLKEWYDRIHQLDMGYNENDIAWYHPELDIADWSEMKLPVTWESAGLEGFDGIVWFRKNVQIPESWSGEDLNLYLGPIDDIDSTYFNGKFIGGIEVWNEDREYKIPAHLVKPGKNTIAVRIFDTGGGGGIWGEANQMKIEIETDNSISIAGIWNYRIGIDSKDLPQKPQNPNNPNQPMVLSNAMIEPLIPFAIRGAIWYQGESNAGRAYQYRELFPALINDWRGRWQQGDFPFLFVQLANWLRIEPDPGESDWAELREAQLMTLSLPNTGMAVTIDIGDAEDIHPKNKQEVGRRLALNALKIAYNKKIVCSGPIYKSMKIEGNHIRIQFDHIAEGLIARDEQELVGFSISGKDKKYYWAKAEIKGDDVIVYNNKVMDPVAVRYGWATNPVCNLYNSAGLPASPFRTDYWDSTTD